MIFFIIKGGRWEVGNDTAKITTTGTKATTTSFKPKGLFLFNTARVATGIADEDITMNIGASDDTNETSGSMTDDDGATTTEIGIMSSSTKCLRVFNVLTQAALMEANVDSFNALNFTLNYTTVDSNAYKFGWIIIGNLTEPVAELAPMNINMGCEI